MFHKSADMRLMMMSLGVDDRKGMAYMSMRRRSPYVGCYDPMIAVASQSLKRSLPVETAPTPKIMALSVIRGNSEIYPWSLKRPYLDDQREAFDHFTPKNMGISAARALVMVVMGPAHEYMNEIIEELDREEEAQRQPEAADEEEEEDDAFHWPDPSRYFIDIPQKVRSLRCITSKSRHMILTATTAAPSPRLFYTFCDPSS